MKAIQHIFFFLCTLTVCNSFGQKNSKIAHYFGDQILVDSSSTIIIPTHYNSDYFSSNKISLSGDFYSNIIFYNFKNDISKKLFDNDTYIISFSNLYYSDRYNTKQHYNNITSQYIFYRVKNIDHNKNGRIDNNDPAILYISDVYGNNLKILTTEKENVVGIDIYEKQNFALIKIQRDHDNNGDYKTDDKDFYFIKLDLITLTFGNKIETR